MKKVIKLDEKDIQQVMAEKFGCDPTHVFIAVNEQPAGYASSQLTIKKVEIIIHQEEHVC